jgi:hypothetical protein
VSEDRTVVEVLKDAVQGALTECADQIGGAQIVGDIVVLVECYMGNGDVVMRHFDSAVPSWRQTGMLRSAMNTLQIEETINALIQVGAVEVEDDD